MMKIILVVVDDLNSDWLAKKKSQIFSAGSLTRVAKNPGAWRATPLFIVCIAHFLRMATVRIAPNVRNSH